MKFHCLHLIIFMLSSGFSLASDHIDGPATRKDKRADITDLYAFPTKGSNEKLNLILNTYPFVVNGHFDSKIKYQFLIKQAKIVNGKIEEGDLNTITCIFFTPHDHDNHKMTCKSSNNLSVTTKFNENFSINVKDELKAYTGKRSDPFFINTDFAVALSEGKIPEGHFPDGSTKLNVLSIALEVNVNKLFKKQSDLYLVAAQSISNNKDEKSEVLDRVGRAEITNITLSNKFDVELRDKYNKEQTFNLSEKKEHYKLRLMDKITRYDSLDGKIHWGYSKRKKLVELLLADYLVLDLSKDCKKPGFLEIEKSLLMKRNHETCGGRKLTDDIVDIMYTFYINRDSGEAIGDDAFGPHKKPSLNFPYLREPTNGFLATLKAAAANLLEF